MKPLLLAAALVPLITLSGCIIKIGPDDWEDNSSGWRQQQKQNAQVISELELARTRGSIENEMGQADIVEAFTRDGADYVVLYYRTRHVESDGITTAEESTPLVFVDNLLVGWGESAIDNATP